MSDKVEMRDEGAALRDHRLARWLTQEQLAEDSGVSVPTIQRLERGEAARITTIVKLAKALGVNPTDIANRATPTRRKGNERRKTIPSI